MPIKHSDEYVSDEQLAAMPAMHAALAWAGIFKCNTVFSLVPLNGAFRMAGSDTVYTKTSERGWYRDESGRKFKTGRHATVIVGEC